MPQQEYANTRDKRKPSWRDIYPVHPAADVFPMLSEEELRKLGEDIKNNGLKEPIVLWSSSGKDDDRVFVLDGRNRLDAMESVGLTILDNWGQLLGWISNEDGEKNPKWPKSNWVAFPPYSESDHRRITDPASYVISKNIRRRHLTKEQQADLIVKVIAANKTGLTNTAKPAERNELAKVARSFSPEGGKRGGSTKDPIKQAAVDEGKKHGISKRTMERALGKATTAKADPLRELEDDLNKALFGKSRRHAAKPPPPAPANPIPKPEFGNVIPNDLVLRLRQLSEEIKRRRKENHDERIRRKWNPDAVLKLEQKRILDWIEEQLAEIVALMAAGKM